MAIAHCIVKHQTFDLSSHFYGSRGNLTARKTYTWHCKIYASLAVNDYTYQHALLANGSSRRTAHGAPHTTWVKD